MPVTRWKKKNINSRLPLYLPGRVFIVDVVRIFPPVPGSEGAMAFCPPKRTGKITGSARWTVTGTKKRRHYCSLPWGIYGTPVT